MRSNETVVKNYEIIEGDSLESLKSIPDGSVNCCITSPPYYGLRDYGTGRWIGGDPNCPHRRLSKYSEKTITGHAQKELAGNVGDAIYKTVCPLCGAVRVDKQIGLEETPAEYIDKLVNVFREVKRVLKEDGTLWVNIGDSYANTNSNNRNFIDEGGRGGNNPNIATRTLPDDIKPKDLIGIPWMLAFALRNDGWYLRQDIIWHKPNPMPESVSDRCTKSHEYIFLLSKNSSYYFDSEAIEEPANYDGRSDTLLKGSNKYSDGSYMQNQNGQPFAGGVHERWKFKQFDNSEKDAVYAVRHKRDVWTVSTKPYKGAHFATYPEELIEPMVLAGCPVDGVILDPFSGSGTTGVVALRHKRKYIGIELNHKYVKLSIKRIEESLGNVVEEDNDKIKVIGRSELW